MEFKQPNPTPRRPGSDIQRRSPAANTRPTVSVEPRPVGQAPSPATKSRTRRFLSAKPVIIGLIIVIVGCLAATGLLTYRFLAKDTAAEKPDYKTVLPAGKDATEFDGWKRISPPENDPVFAYADRIDGVSVSVSQQPLPQDFKNNIASKVAELAQKFNATNKLEADDITIYAGVSAKGPQSIIFAKDDVLVLIKSDKKVSDAAWIRYAESLN